MNHQMTSDFDVFLIDASQWIGNHFYHSQADSFAGGIT